MFEDTVYNYDTLHTRMREEAFLNAGLRITIADERAASADKPEEERYHSMHYKGGIPKGMRYFYGCGDRTRTCDLRVMRQYHAQIGVISAPICAFCHRSFGESSIVSVQPCQFQPAKESSPN